MKALVVVLIINNLHLQHTESQSPSRKSCSQSHCYHLIDPRYNSPVLYKRHHDRTSLSILEKQCLDEVSRDSWLLEIYDEVEQNFVEKFISDHVTNKEFLQADRMVVVPLNLKIGYQDGWTWLNGSHAGNLTSQVNNHFAYLQVNDTNISLISTSSDMALHKGLCHIPRKHCKELRSSFVVKKKYCLYKIHESLTWHQARWACHQRKGELSSIIPGYPESLQIRMALDLSPRHLRGHMDLWIGLKNIEEYWIKNNSPAIYTNWGGYPISPLNNFEFALLEMDSRKWRIGFPNYFELKIVCMTVAEKDNDFQGKSFEDNCQPTITCLIVVNIITFMVLLSIGLLYAKDKIGFSIPLLSRTKQRDEEAILQSFENQSINHSINQSINQPFNQSINHDGFEQYSCNNGVALKDI